MADLGSFGDLTQGIGTAGITPASLNFGGAAGSPLNLSGIGGTQQIAQAGQGGIFGGLFGSGAGTSMGQIGGNAGSSGLLGIGQLGLSGIGSLGSLYTGLKSLGLAQDQFNFQKQLANTNLANQTQSYNTALSDKANSRAFAEGQSPAQAASYIAANKLSS